MKNYYDILGIEINASSDEIKAAYKALVKKFHPDVNPQQREFFEKKSKSINEAYEILSNPSKKSSYDMRLKEFLNRQQSSQANDNYNRQKEEDLKRREEELRKKQNENDRRQREKEEELKRKQDDFDRKQREKELTDIKAQSTQKPVKEGTNRKPIFIAIGILLFLVAGFGIFFFIQKENEILQKENELWVKAKIENRSLIYKEFLDKYPTGIHSTEALDSLKISLAKCREEREKCLDKYNKEYFSRPSPAISELRTLGYSDQTIRELLCKCE